MQTIVIMFYLIWRLGFKIEWKRILNMSMQLFSRLDNNLTRRHQNVNIRDTVGKAAVATLP